MIMRLRFYPARTVLIIVISLLTLGAAGIAYAAPLYTPGQTLNPDCLPTNPDCTVTTSSNTTISILSATTSLPNITTLAGLTSATNLSSVGSLTSGSIGVGFGNVNIGSNTFTGNGSSLTNLNAGNISTGDLAVANARIDNLSISNPLSFATTSDQDFTFVVFPDTQGVVENNNGQWASLYNYVVSHKTSQNIQAVIGVGDVVDDANDTQYGVASYGYNQIDAAGIPYAVIAGNHDGEPLFGTYFGPSRYSGKSWYGGSYDSTGESFYETFMVGSQKFMILGLAYYPSDAILAWAQGILDAHPDYYTILDTHAYLDHNGQLVYTGDAYGPTPPQNSGQDMWYKLVSKNSQIRLTLNGHFICSPQAAHNSMVSSTTGQYVNSLFVDYQCSSPGYMGLLRFSPANGSITVSFYAPSLAANDPNQPSFTFPYDPVSIKGSLGVQTDLNVGGNALVGGSVMANNMQIGLNPPLTSALARLAVNVNSNESFSSIFSVSKTTVVTDAYVVSPILTVTNSNTVGVGTTTNFAKLSVDGSMLLTGNLYDSLFSAGSEGYLLQSTGSGVRWVPGGAGGVPGGSDTYIQYNDGGILGGDSGFTWNKTTKQLSLSTSRDANMVLYLPFIEGSGTSMADYSGNANNGTASTPNWVSNGLTNNALSLNGIVGNVVSVPSNDTLKNLSNMTVSVWVFATTTIVAPFPFIVSKFTGSTNGKFFINLTSANINVSTVNDSSSRVNSQAGMGKSISDGIWHNIVFTYDGSLVRVYLDGSSLSVSNAAQSGTLKASTENICIGAYGNGCEAYSGSGISVDEVKIWNSVLSDSNISSLYVSRGITTNGPILKLTNNNSSNNATLNFNGISGNIAKIFSDLNGNSGTDLNLSAATSAGTLNLMTGGSAAANIRMAITAAGNVGIGTTTPYAKLSVAGSSGGTTPLFAISTSTAAATTTVFQIDQNGILTMNTPGATSTINGNLYVNGTLRSTTSYNGDLFFGNNFSFTEAPLDGSPQGLLLKNQNGSTTLSIDESGNLTVNGDICGNGTQCFGKSITSLSKDVNALASSTALSILSTTASTGQSLSELSSSIATVSAAITALGTKVDALSSTTLALASTSTIDSLASSTADTLASSTPSFIERIALAVQSLIQSAGKWAVGEITATLAVFTDVKTTSIETQTASIQTASIQTASIQTASVKNGIEMTDSVTSKIYCIRIANGDFDKTQGSCAETATSTVPVVDQTPNANVQVPNNNQTLMINNQVTSSASTTTIATSTTTSIFTDTTASTTASTSSATTTSSIPTDPASTTPSSATIASSTTTTSSGSSASSTDSGSESSVGQ
jgi:hypothetical protein